MSLLRLPNMAYLSSVLNSQRAIQVNIRIMRVFNQIRTAIMGATDILKVDVVCFNILIFLVFLILTI